MAGLLKLVAIGNLGRDPEATTTPNGASMTKFNVAVTVGKKKGGEWEDVTTWLSVVVFGAQGERLMDRLHKGSKVYLEGRIDVREYESKGEKRFSVDVIADNVIDLTPRERSTSDDPGAYTGDWTKPVSKPTPGSDESDLPF